MTVQERLARVEGELPWIANATRENRDAVTTLTEKFDSYVRMTLGGLASVAVLIIIQWVTSL